MLSGIALYRATEEKALDAIFFSLVLGKHNRSRSAECSDLAGLYGVRHSRRYEGARPC